MKKPALIIIGIDGGTYKIIDPLIEQGKLPNIKRLIEEGSRLTLKSTLPPLTAPAWVSLMTGVNPGKHGLFDFKKLDKITYDMPFNPLAVKTHNIMHSRYYAGKTIWDILSRKGLKISVLMMPMTYPAWEVNGYMLAGFPSPDFKNPDGHPKEWACTLGEIFDISVSINDKDKMVKETRKLNAKLEQIILEQIAKDECDVYTAVFSSTDFLQHYLWKDRDEKDSKYAHAIDNAYIEIDDCIGRIMEPLDSQQTNFIVLSDHGFTQAPGKYFHTNAWLIKEGYLAAKEKGRANKITDLLFDPLRYQKIGLRMSLKKYFKYLPQGIQNKISGNYYATNQFIWEKTKAFRYKINTLEGIVINLKGKYPCGTVERQDYETIREEIINKLKNLKDAENGSKVIAQVHKREEVYSGKFIDFVPDIVFLTDNDYKGGVGINKHKITENIHAEMSEIISGVHDMDGILILSGKDFKKGGVSRDAQMVDIFPTILNILGLPLPPYADGRIIKDALNKEINPLSAGSLESNLFEENTDKKLSKNEEELIAKSLKGLGYL